ncbi:MAG: serine/threonine protein kinase [Candidatus Hydrogenedentes bacterium]|nr:serine/threonine protein kinase [Candidatus Hydrogenedentota bacterium]
MVYLSEDTTLSRDVALKVLYPSLSTDTVFIDRFKSEARIVATILHPNIVRINSLETIDHNLAIDMEFVAGPSLGHTMAHEVFSPLLAVQIARDVLDGLAVCHDLGVVHRDIKPNNILLSPQGRAKLADFGLATAYATHLETSIYRLTSSEFFMGTPRFAPPEAWEGGHPQPDWDLYSLGLVLYEGLSGKPVYDGTTPLAIVKQLMSTSVAPLRDVVPSVSKELGQFIDRLISRDQSKRYKDAAAALADLRAVPEFSQTAGDDAPTIRTAVRSVQRKTSFKRRVRVTKRAIAWTAGAVALALVSSIATWTLLEPPASQDSMTATPGTVGPVITQQEICQTRLPTVEDILSHPKSAAGSESRVFNARYFQVAGEEVDAVDRTERWLIGAAGESGSRRVIAFSDKLVLSGELRESAPGNVAFTGNWASYQYDSGAGFQEGTAEGRGAWMAAGNALNMSLRLDNRRRHIVEDYTVSVALADDWRTESEFTYGIENASLLQPLLFTELAPRPESWAETVIDLLPSVWNARCMVPMLGKNMPVNVDGKLDEEVWTRSYFDAKGRIGSIRGFPLSLPAEFSARVTADHVLIGMSIDRPVSQRWGVHIAVMPVLPSPLGKQEFMKVFAASDGSRSASFYREGVERPWEGEPWQVELYSGDRGVSCEVAINLGGLAPGVIPDKNVVWRINACITEGADDTQENVVAAWGFPDMEAVEHGALLRFEENVL